MWVEVRDRSELRNGSVVDLRVVDILVVDVRLDMDELTAIGLSVIGTLAGLSYQTPRIKISVNTDISVIGFYGNIGKISVDIFTKISVIKFFLYFNYIDYEK